MTYKVPAYVLGGGMNGLSVVRNLGRNGVTVYCVLEKSDQVIYSKYCKKSFIVQNIENDPSVLKKFFVDPEKQRIGGVLFSTTDLFSFYLSKLKDDLKSSYQIQLPSHEVIKTLVNKKDFYQSLSKYGIPHPVTYFPENLLDVKCISKEIKYPIFIKPVNSQEFSLKFYSKGFVANTSSELIKYYLLMGDPKQINVVGESLSEFSKIFPKEKVISTNFLLRAQSPMLKIYKCLSGDIIPPVFEE